MCPCVDIGTIGGDGWWTGIVLPPLLYTTSCAVIGPFVQIFHTGNYTLPGKEKNLVYTHVCVVQ